jgi:hypothetical protein
MIANSVLPSICSSELSTVIIDVHADGVLVDYQGWQSLERDLCRLAKLFKAKHGGRKMVVEIQVLGGFDLLGQYPMSMLGVEATVVFRSIDHTRISFV